MFLNLNHLPVEYRFAIILSLVEYTIGGIGHSLKLPFVGYFLSLHQIFCITRALQFSSSPAYKIPLFISSVSALLKTLTPMGKRLTPMLAITMQGILYNLGIVLFGNTLIGQLTGAVLSSFWGFIQPFLISYLIFGQELINGIWILESWVNAWIPWLNLPVFIVSCFIGKALFAFLAVYLARTVKDQNLALFHQQLERVTPQIKRRTTKSLLKGLILDLTSPWFVLSLLITICALIPMASTKVDLVLSVLRVVTSAILIFGVLRLINIQSFSGWLQKRGYLRFSKILNNCISQFIQTLDLQPNERKHP